MMKYKHMAKRALLWLLLFVSIMTPLPCFADLVGIETLPYPEDEDVCDYQDSIKMTGPKWWDKPMTAALNASVAIGNGVFSNVAGGAIRLMIVGGMLWLAIFILKIVGGMVESDPMENVTKIGGMMLRIGIAAALLSSPNFFFSYFFAPIIEAGAGFVGVGGSSTKIDGGLASAAGAARGIADAIHESVAGVQADAWHLKCMSKIHKLSLGFDFMLWDPGIFFSGCMIYAAALAFGLVFPFFLIDACFRMGVVAALCPLFIVAWVFQSTRDYASKGFQATLNVAFTFMMVKIVMDIALKMIVGSSGLGSISDGPEAEKLALCTYRFVNFSDSDPCAGYSSGTAGTTSNILIFTASVAYGLLLLRQGASELAGYFAGASFSNDTAFQAAKGGAQAMASGAHHAVTGAAKAAGGVAAVAGVAGKAAGAIANSKVGKAVGGAIKNSAVGRMASRVQSAHKNHQERRMQRRADVKQAVGDKFQAAGDAVRQGGRNLRNNIRGKLGMQSVEEKRQAKYDANAKQRDANEKARQERQDGRKERAANRAMQQQGIDARKAERAKIYASGDKDKIAEARKQEKADLKLEQNLRKEERMDARERARDSKERASDSQQAARDRAQASRNDFAARAGQRELNRAERASNHADRKAQRRDDLSSILHGDAGRPDALKQEGGKAADNSGAKADNNAVPPPPPPPPARPAEPPKGVSKNARFDEKTQTWMTVSTDKRSGGTTETHYDNSGNVTSRTKYDSSNRMISDEQMKDGKTSQTTQSFNSKGELTQKTVTTKNGNTRILGVEGGNVVSNAVTHGDGTVDRIPVGKNTADSAGVVEDKNGNRSGK